MTTSTLDLDALHLDGGGHGKRSEGVCLLEAVAWAAGESHSDMPDCVSPLLRRFGIRLNDALPDDRRQDLKRFIPDLIGTRDDGHDDARSALASQWLMTEALPAWLRLAKLDDLADKAEQSAGLTGQELRTALYSIRSLTWDARVARRQELKDLIAAKIRERMPAAAVADAVAAAVAAAVAVAAADAAAAAAAAAAAVADAVADQNWGSVYTAVKKAMLKHYEESDTFAAVRDLRAQQLDSAIDLYDRMIHVGNAA